MKSIREKREMELRRIIKDIYGIKRRQENNQMIIVYDYLHMKVKQLQNKGLLWHIDIPEGK
jgi:hypothetical protein|tara:strand:- start:384 stop:566 length:183 start_codon:yes stop_codon:yes gene_type:complete